MRAGIARPTSSALVCALVLPVLLAFPALPAAELRPGRECLPEETVLVVRVPGLNAFIEELRARTRFGAVVLDAARLTKAWPLLAEEFGTDDAVAESQPLEEALAEYGLEIGDLHACGAGDAGLGLVVQKRDDGLPPLVMALAWLEPGAEPATRMVAAFRRLLEEAQDDGADAPRRMDLQLAGHDVAWAVVPLLGPDLADLDAEGELDPERLAELRRELADRTRDEKLVQTGQVHVFMTALGDRLACGMTLPAGDVGPGLAVRVEEGRAVVEVRAERAIGAPRDFDRESGTEAARAIAERFLAAHEAPSGPAPDDLLQRPGVRAALPDGTPLIEAVLDTGRLVEVLAAGDDEARRRLGTLGLADLGPIALKAALDGDRMRQGIFVSLPAPRTGLAGILDQPCDAAEIPSFATAEAIDLTRISLDLGAAYRTVREFAVAEGGEQAANMFTVAEMQAQGWLGLDLPAFLTGLGTRHWVVSYPPPAEGPAGPQDDDGDDDDAATADRAAFVWALADDAPFTKVLPKLAALAQQEVVEEQGFRGVRLPNGPAVFVGRGHLVVGLGAESLEKTLAGIRTPPAGAASLREGEVFRRVDALLGLGPARMFSIGDATRTGGMLGELRDALAAIAADDVEEDERDSLAALQALLPTAAEMEGMFGVHGATMDVGEHGVAFRSAWEMPAP